MMQRLEPAAHSARPQVAAAVELSEAQRVQALP